MLSETNHSLSKEEINQLPLGRYDGEVIQIGTPEGLAEALKDLRRERVLGFDTETKPSFKKGTTHKPALIQLAGSERVYLFLLRKFPLESDLAALLSDPAIIKAGVAIRDDMRFLTALHDFAPAGMADLGDLARKNNLGVYGLRPLAAQLLGMRISKSARCSNWNNDSLTAQQVSYAATDAWISRQIYLRMAELGFSMSPGSASPRK